MKLKYILIGTIIGFILNLVVFMTLLGQVTNRITYNTMHDYDKEFNRACEELYGEGAYNLGCKIYYLIWKLTK